MAEVSSLSLIFPTAGILLPLARFPALVWLLGTGLAMPKARVAQNGA